MPIIRVLRQRNWTEHELKSAGFQYYETRKRLVMAKVLREIRNIEVTLETLIAGAGDIVCYDPGQIVHEDPDDYDHWPVKRALFMQTYRPWDDPNWRPNPAEARLMQYGCRPYYKVAGIWAQKLDRSVYLQSLESPRPVLLPPGRWLCIGSQGEPYHMSEIKFSNRYEVS